LCKGENTTEKNTEIPEEKNIRAALEVLDRDLVIDALALLLAEKGEPPPPPGKDTPEFANFAQAILFLKKNHDFAELDLFSTEADLVYITAGERRILLTDTPVSRPKAAGKENPPEGNPAGGGRFSHLEM
jgi:hypothetical protein